MRRSAWIPLTWLVIVLVSSLLLTSLAAAQRGRRGGSNREREAARTAYAEGAELFKQGRYDEAEASFQEAYSHVANPLVLLGIAETRERRGDIPGTIEILEQYLAETDSPSEADRTRLRIGDLKSRPAIIDVTSQPEGASILLDGEDTGLTTPNELEVTPGEHSISVTLDGYMASANSVETNYGTKHELSFELSPVEEDSLPQDPLGEGGAGAGGGALDGDGDQGDPDHMAGVWVASGLAAAAVVTGTVLGFLALSEQSAFDDNPTEETADTGERLALFADVAFGVAAAAALTAIVLYATGNEQPDKGGTDDPVQQDAVSAAPFVGPTGGGVSARVRF